jgi:signal peptidase I
LKDFLPSQTFIVPQNGMYPELPRGSTFRCNNYAYSEISNIKYGDVVAFRHQWKGQEYVFVWRVVALPGDRVVTNGQDLRINQKLIGRSIVRNEQDFDIYQENNKDVEYLVAFSKRDKLSVPEVDLIVPPGHVFVMGDNRYDALDSRALGPVTFKEIVCKKI